MTEETTLLTCPMCGKNEATWFYDQDGYDRELCSIGCRSCGFETKAHLSEKAAEREWNTLPRQLRWTKEHPTKEGWYWHHISPSFGTVIEYFDSEISDGRFHEGDDWAGPIQMPTE